MRRQHLNITILFLMFPKCVILMRENNNFPLQLDLFQFVEKHIINI